MTTREFMAQKLRELRKAHGLSVDEVGAAIAKSGKTISAWEVGRGQPDADKLMELCRLFEVHISDFYNDNSLLSASITSDEDELLDSYRALNETGRQMARAMVSALVKSGEYVS